MPRWTFREIREDGCQSLMRDSKSISGCRYSAHVSHEFHSSRIGLVRKFNRSFLGQLLRGTVTALLFAGYLLLAGCGDDTSQKPVAEAPTKPAEPAIPEDIQAAAEKFLGNETQVLVYGDLAKTGKQEFLAANVVPKSPKNQLTGTIVTRAVLAEKNGDQWSELLRCDEFLKNSKGFLAMTPLDSVAGWRVQFDQDPVKGIQLYFTPVKGAGASDQHALPIGIAWNPATKRYQSLDRTYEHFLLESPSLSTARSVLR